MTDAHHMPVWVKNEIRGRWTSIQNSGAWSRLREAVFKAYGRRCMRCGSGKKANADHIIPKSKAPELALEWNNLQVLCEDCNFQKGQMVPVDYRDHPMPKPPGLPTAEARAGKHPPAPSELPDPEESDEFKRLATMLGRDFALAHMNPFIPPPK